MESLCIRGHLTCPHRRKMGEVRPTYWIVIELRE